jgi:hypothetical protein
MVERCVHYVAAHEVRDSFPLDSIRDGKHYPPNCFEVVYPGVHTDVGGGYAPGEQTRALEDRDKLSQIPLLHMYRAARETGVPLRSLDGTGAKVRAYFDLSPKTIALYDAYRKRVQARGPIETAIAEHLRQLYIARSYLAKTMNDAAARARLPRAKKVLSDAGNEKAFRKQDEQLKLITAGGLALSTAMSRVAAKKREGRTLTLRECALASAYENAIEKPESITEQLARVDFFDKQKDEELKRITAGGSALSTAMSRVAANKSEGRDLTPRECTSASAYESAIKIAKPTTEQQALVDFFDYLVHDSVAGFGLDFSKLQNWRITYFGDVSYVPDRSLAQADAHVEDTEAMA